MNADEYRRYLAGRVWRDTRHHALARAGHRCQACGSAHRLDVHHRSYARLGHENPDDLRVLCRNCHERVHHTPRPLDAATDLVCASPPDVDLSEPASVTEFLRTAIHLIALDAARQRHPSARAVTDTVDL